MNFILMFAHYIWWHYTTAIVDIFRICLNIEIWLKNFFSLGYLSRNLFVPWRRRGEVYPTGFNLSEFLSSLVVNTLMRGVGFFIRLIVILVGLVALLLGLISFLLVLLIWVLMPLILLFLIVFGFKLLVE